MTDLWEVIKWLTPAISLLIVHMWRKLDALDDKIDAHHVEWVGRLTRLEAKIINGDH